jgi:hypothetical protein
VPVSLPPSESPDEPAALDPPSSPGKAGASPGNSTLVVSAVVVVDLTSVELVANSRMVVLVLLVLAFAVEDVVVARASVEVVVDADVDVVTFAETTTTPVMPWLRWTLQ